MNSSVVPHGESSHGSEFGKESWVFMNGKRLLSWLSCVAALFAVLGCDLSAPKSSTSDGSTFVGTTSTGLTSPILLGIEGVSGGSGEDSSVLCPGVVVKLSGFNFSDDLAAHRVEFSAGDESVLGMPVAVSVSRNQTPAVSTLDVVVPGGVSQGTIQLFVDGVAAGAVGFDSCPVLYAITLGALEDQDSLPYQPLVGFAQGSTVTVYGLNLSDAQAVVLSDGRGGQQEVPASAFVRNNAFVAGQVPTGYESFRFSLNDDTTDIRFPYSNPPDRANLHIAVRTPNGRSNTLQAPVVTNAATRVIGAAINAVRVPTGVVTGPVKIHYQLYERIIDASWLINVDWRVPGVTDSPPLNAEIPNASGWVSAKPLDTHPDHSGIDKVIGGPIVANDGNRLLPGGGALRTFVWDAQCDQNFRLMRELAAGTGPEYVVEFRIRPEPDVGNRTFVDHLAETPPILYLDLENQVGGQDRSAQREAVFVDSFDTDINEETSLTTASWGPPLNRGLLVGSTEAPAISTFGEGTARVILQAADPATLVGQGTVTDQFFLINTDRMEITRRVVRDIGGTPVEEVTDYLFTDTGLPTGAVVGNPGRALGEFHVGEFKILNPDFDGDGVSDAVTQVRVVGARPLVVRVRGIGGTPSPFDESFVVDGTLSLNGGAGGGAVDAPGAGGVAVAGGGAGGNGASLALAGLGDAEVRTFTNATRGGNFGGGPGETPAAVGSDIMRNSLFAGGPGGGGGHLVKGGDGEYGTSNVNDFQTPRVGFGGPARGDPTQVPQTAGSGGGGGGATISFTTAMGAVSVGPGAGGGAGGGAARFTVRGTLVVNGTISANGGDGGTATTTGGMQPAGAAPGGAGGGGSGGSIVARATGDVLARDCDAFQVNGGQAGVGGNSNGQNSSAGSGDGAPGYVRLESAFGGTPFCNNALQASTRLTSNLRDSRTANTAAVESVAGFPPTGRIQINNEIMFYGSVSAVGAMPAELRDLVRDPDTRAAHSTGDTVVLLSTVVPPADGEVLLDGGLTRGPDDIDFGLGRDGVLHLRFVASLNAVTGLPLLDPETGRATSIWVFNTDSGTLSSPSGSVVFETRLAATAPGRLDLVSLQIDEDVVLRGLGSQPLEILVRERAEIFGTIDVSGVAGGALRFAGDGSLPRFGLGGAPGAGGGRGGDGGTIEFVDNDPTNDANPANVVRIDGAPGAVPARLAILQQIDPTGAFGVPRVVAPTGGGSIAARDCGVVCLDSAGGGAGGGALRAGARGSVLNPLLLPEADARAGRAGSAMGFEDFRFQGELFLVGGIGGAGGGASPQVSETYLTGSIMGQYTFKSRARFAPGTAGGGGGGVIYLAAANLHLRTGARLLARGGDAFQSIDLGGNGGAGGGGSVFIRVANNFSLDDGVTIDVRGGRADRLPPLASNGIPLYEGNRRPTPNDAPSLDGLAFGGNGGAGSAGMIRIETSRSSGIAAAGINRSVSSGPFLQNVVESVATSRLFRVGLGPGLVASSSGIQLGSARVLFNVLQQPSGTRAVVLWEGASESLSIHGAASAPSQSVRDPRNLRGTDFARFRVYFQSNFNNRTSRSIQEIGLPISLRSNCLGF